MTIHAFNSLDHAGFMHAIAWIFEHSPWVAERASAVRPFESIDALHLALVGQVEHASEAEQLALLRAHPDLGTRARMSDASTAEQSGAGLDRLTPQEFGRLQTLNAAYRDKFGFPFLFAVKGSGQHQILDALTDRLESSWEQEFRVALRQVYRIARFRLEDILE